MSSVFTSDFTYFSCAPYRPSIRMLTRRFIHLFLLYHCFCSYQVPPERLSDFSSVFTTATECHRFSHRQRTCCVWSLSLVPEQNVCVPEETGIIFNLQLWSSVRINNYFTILTPNPLVAFTSADGGWKMINKGREKERIRHREIKRQTR